MINKNKFSIKDTKKVLHKVGKRWVVVSAVLLGLAAGGAAVTNANADTTQAAQPTAAQQVAKNANMSSANHSFGASDPVNVTKASASSATMKLGAADGSINIKGHNVPTTKQGIKNDVKHYASYANVYNLSALASKADTNNASAQYSDLVNLASNAPSQFNSYEVGSDVSTNSNANTLFGILNDASSDINAINNGNSNSKLTKISHALSDVQSLALNSSYRSGDPISVSVPNSGISVNVGSSVALLNAASSVGSSLSSVNKELNNMGLNGISLSSGTTFPVTPFSSMYNINSAHASMSASVSVNIPSIIDNGITESSADSLISSVANDFITTASNNVTPNAMKFAENLASSNNLASQVTSDIANSLVSNNESLITNATLYNSVYNTYSTLSSAVTDNNYNSNRYAQSLLNNALRKEYNPTEVSEIEQQIQANPDVMNTGIHNRFINANGIIPTLGDKLSTVKIPNNKLRTQLQNSSNVKGTVTNYISGLISPYLNEGSLKPVIDNLVEGKIQSFLGSIKSEVSNITGPNGDIATLYDIYGAGLFGPFTSKNISNASNYSNIMKAALTRLPSPFNKDQSKISKANVALDAVKNGIADASHIASDVANTPDMNSEYNAVVNNAANLASDLPNNVSAYNDYNDMYTNASLLANGLSTDHNRIANHIMTNVAIPASNIAQTYLTSDSIVFNGDPSANYTLSGVKGTTGTVYAPQDYHFNDNNSQETITFNGHTYTFNVTKNSATPSNPVQPINPAFIPSFNNGSSVNTYYEPSTVSGNVESTVRYANYVLVTKALQLHTNPNFTKRNGVAVIKPGVVLNVEKTVRARHNLIRYEVRYNNKNYFVTANKHFVAYNRYELAQPSHYSYAKVDTALQLHQSTNFTKKNGVKVVKPGTEFRINRVVKSNKGVTRYEVNYKDSVYFITASSHYVENAYVQKSNFGKRGHKAVRATKPVNEYRHANFSKRGLVRHFRRGTVLPVRRVFTIGKGEITRLQLTNGRYVSANKDFVEVIK